MPRVAQLLALLLLSSGATSALAQHRLTRADLEAWLDGYMPYALQSDDVAGAVIVAVTGGSGPCT